MGEPSAARGDGQAARELRVTARWEEQLPDLLRRLQLPVDGVVQVGAHVGQEVEPLARCGFRRLVLMEPNHDHTAELEAQLRRHHRLLGSPTADGVRPSHRIVVAAAGRVRGEATLYVTEWDQQASVLPPLLPLSATNAVVRQDRIPIIPVREVQDGCNVLVIDAQGAELDVLAGADLRRLHLAVVEGSTVARYRDGSTLDSIADHMRANGWSPVATWAHVRPGVEDVAWLAPHRPGSP